MSGWFPKLNRNGDVVSGDGVVFVNGETRGPGNKPVWNGPGRVVASGLPGSVLIDTATGARVDVALGFNELSGEQRTGQWAGWKPGDDRQGFAAFYRGGETEPWTTAAGITAPQYSDLGSHLAYINPYQAIARNLICDNRPIASGPITSVSVCESAIVWQVASGMYTYAVFGARFGADGLPGATEYLGILPWEDPQVFDTPEGPWVLSVTQDPGVMLRPFGSNRGYRLVGLFYYPHAAFVQGRIRIVSSSDHGAAQSMDIALTDPRVVLADQAVPPVTTPPKPPDPVIPPKPVDPPKEPPVSFESHPLPDFIAALLPRWIAKYPLPEIREGEGDDQFTERMRGWMAPLHEQIEFLAPGKGYGRKRGDPGRPLGKDTIPRVTRLGSDWDGHKIEEGEGWDLFQGTSTGHPRYAGGVGSVDLAGQWFEHVPAVDHMGDGPVDPPVDPPVGADAPGVFPALGYAIVGKLQAKFPGAVTGTAQQRRDFMFALAQQCAFSISPKIGVKRAAPDRDRSKNALGFQGDPLVGWVLFTEAGALIPAAKLEPMTGQVFEAVTPVDVLGLGAVTPPVVTPPVVKPPVVTPPSDGTLAARLSELELVVRDLRNRPAGVTLDQLLKVDQFYAAKVRDLEARLDALGTVSPDAQAIAERIGAQVAIWVASAIATPPPAPPSATPVTRTTPASRATATRKKKG